jgi:enoyl-CoA hydratase/carnithine racemase
MNESLSVEDRGPVRHLCMTGRPRRGNPLSRKLARELLAMIREAEAVESVRVIVLSGTESHFSVGADLKEVNDLTATAAVLDDWLIEFDDIARSRKPLIAAVRGHAVGGGFELALTCDLIVCAMDAFFALPETGIGVIAGQGGTQRLIQLAGRAIASDLILTGRVLSGEEAAGFGIAARAVVAEQVIEEAQAIGEAIARRSVPAIRFAREVLREAAEGHLQQSFRIERLLAALVLDTDDRKKRVGAFLERSKK